MIGEDAPSCQWGTTPNRSASAGVAVGRDPAEITCSVHLSYGKDDDPAALAEAAAQRFAEGVDLVVFSMASPYDASMLEPLAEALSDRS